jgi:flagellar biosynthetic protein FlhB
MSDESSTHAPSKRRLREARDRGLVAHSPELTAAVGLVAALGALGVWGDDLGRALVDLVRATLQSAGSGGAIPAVPWDAVVRVLMWLLACLGAVFAAVVGAHQAQTRGLWVPGLAAPDPMRLVGGLGAWRGGASRAGWSVLKAGVMVALATVLAWDLLPRLAALPAEAPANLATRGSAAVRWALEILALAAVGLGVGDLLMRGWRLEAQLRQTPEQVREELKAAEGDPATRARQRGQARGWRRTAPGALDDAVLVVTAGRLLAVVLGGEGPPGSVTVQRVARGLEAVGLLREAQTGRCGVVEEPALARALAGSRGRPGPWPAAWTEALAAIWPRKG